MRKKVTIQEIADAVGMSKYAVSRALAGKSGVSAETRQFIVDTAQKLGYFSKRELASPSPLQNRFAGQKSIETIETIETILILFPNVRYQNTDSLYWGPVFNGISSALNQRGINILTLTEPSGDSIFTLLNPDGIQGIIAVGSISTPILLELQHSGIPIVIVDHHDEQFHADSIFTDNTNSMLNLMKELIKAGFSSFQFIGNIREAASFKDRWLGFRLALEEHNIPNQQNPRLIGPEADTIYTVLPNMARDRQLPEVFVCANDTYAFFAIETLKNEGLSVPEVCQFTGFDYTYPDLALYATVDVHKEVIGMRAVDQLLWRIANPKLPYERRLIGASVVRRFAHTHTNA